MENNSIQPGDLLLNKYRVEKLLGSGAFGDVYLVTHLGLKVLRAVKVLRRDAPGVGSSDFNNCLLRFQLEAELGAQLNTPNPNPHLLLVHNYEEKDNVLLLEMEYASGGSLHARLADLQAGGGLMPLGEALQMAAEVAQGLAALHARDIIHRDLKPSNILFDGQGHARLADLGLAEVPGGPSMRSRLSQPVEHPGTPLYMSPEQAESRAVLNPASDIHSLGLVLFEALTGRVYRRQRPGTRATAFRAEVPAWLDDLLVRMLSTSPGDRPWDGKETAALLLQGAAQIRQALEEQARQAADAGEKTRLEQERRKRETAQQEQARQEELTRQRERAEAEKEKLAQKHRRQAEKQAQREAQARQAVPPQSQRRQPWLAWGLGLLGIVGLVALVIVLGKGLGGGDDPAATEAPATPTRTYTSVPTQTSVPTRTSTQISPTQTAEPVAGATEVRSTDGMVMVYVPAGEFEMGMDADDALAICKMFYSNCDRNWFIDEEPVHTVYLDGYWIDQTEVTNGEYVLCVVAGECDMPDSTSSYTRSTYYGNDFGYVDYPVINVSWHDALAYCEWAGAELPSEAEWEKAARGEDGRVYPWGDSDPTCSLANFDPTNSAACIGDTASVGSYPDSASPYGVFDLAGNVWEWVNDWYGDTYYSNSPASNPPGPSSGTYRVLRGGSWGDLESFVRSAGRGGVSPSGTHSGVGFRCSRSLP